MSVLRRAPIRASLFDLHWLLFPGLIALPLLGTVLLWGQSLTKEYINLNGRTLAVETPVPIFTMVGVAPGGSYPIHTTQQTIGFQISSPTGIDHIEFMLNNLWNSTDACNVTYWPANNELDFDDPAGNTSAYTFGASATQPSVSNYACTLDLVHTSITATTTSATLNLPITLLPSSVGTQNLYVTIIDSNFNFFYGGIPRASWTAFDEITTAPPTYTLLNTLTTSNSQTLYFKFSDGNGFRYIDQVAQVMLAAASDAAGNNSPCYLWLLPIQQWANLSSWSNGVETAIGSATLGQAGSITGHPCSIPDLLNSKVHINPNPALPDPNPNTSVVTDMYLDLVLSLDTTVAHPEGVFAGDIDRAGRGVLAGGASGSTAFQVGTWP